MLKCDLLIIVCCYSVLFFKICGLVNICYWNRAFLRRVLYYSLIHLTRETKEASSRFALGFRLFISVIRITTRVMLCMRLILCRIMCYLRRDFIVNPRMDDSDHVSGAISKFTRQFNKHRLERCWGVSENLKAFPAD